MNNKAIKSALGRSLNEATETLEVFESLPQRHALRDRSVVITPVDEDRDLGAHGATDTILGWFTATVPALDLEPLRSLCSQLEGTDAPVYALAAVSAAMRSIEEFRTQYLQGAFASLTIGTFTEAVGAHAANARQALDAADQACKEWLAGLAASDKNVAVKVGTTIGDQTLLSTADVARLSGTSVGAAQKWISERGFPVQRIGKRKFVVHEDLLAATREEAAGTTS